MEIINPWNLPENGGDDYGIMPACSSDIFWPPHTGDGNCSKNYCICNGYDPE